ncbi:LacI family transcriptional regulator [Micromonospora yasonensis]|uniref:LacI family DNA-binding transcriptional regulator n=1 Tax=Micromonospora yasonensis TaxID=1128667 RepID=UPI00222FA558|nr:LacI family DNA-binding transcriptional regulator [Micromonospora yasonensis]MCW3842759.1 LacI family transcriptional regulator [Micromonospora yasonensis]
MASIAEVAARAGVSPTTVSHALSGKRRVSPAVKERVAAAMAELGYVPSRSAQSLALGATRVIALVVPDISIGYFAELARGVEAAAVRRGYNVILCTTGFDSARELHYLQMVHSRAVDGIVYAAGAPPTDQELSDLLGAMPLVFVDEEIEGTRLKSVISDNEAGGRLAAEHLLGLGHRNVLILGAEGEPFSSSRRIAAFQRRWEDGGGTVAATAWGRFTESSGALAVAPHVASFRAGDVTAVFAINDLMAIGALYELRRAGVRVPEDVSVVGFDDVMAAQYCFPSLTTVRQDVPTLGQVSTDALIDALEGLAELDGEQLKLPVGLVARDSTGPVRGGRR